jgi:hypothetical protein
VYRVLEDTVATPARPVVIAIQISFLLPKALAEFVSLWICVVVFFRSSPSFPPHALVRRYAHVLFLCHHRFESTKKRLLFLNFADMDYISAVLMEHWAEARPPHRSLVSGL